MKHTPWKGVLFSLVDTSWYEKSLHQL